MVFISNNTNKAGFTKNEAEEEEEEEDEEEEEEIRDGQYE
jgi:hypothetical protein